MCGLSMHPGEENGKRGWIVDETLLTYGTSRTDSSPRPSEIGPRAAPGGTRRPRNNPRKAAESMRAAGNGLKRETKKFRNRKDETHMKKLWKRLGALMMTLAMVLSLGAGITAFAAGSTTINLTNIEDGDTVTLYQLVSYNTDETDLVVTTEFANYLKTNGKGGLTSSSSNADVVDYLKGLSESEIEKLMNTYVQTSSALPSAYGAAQIAPSSGKVTFNVTKHGYYVAVVTPSAKKSDNTPKTAMHIYSATTFFFGYEGGNEVLYLAKAKQASAASGTAAVKNKIVPSLEKKVLSETTWQETNTANVGDTVDFRIELTLPALPAGQTLDSLVVTDNLTDMVLKGAFNYTGSVLNSNTVFEIYANAPKGDAGATLLDNSAFKFDGTANQTFVSSDAKTLNISLAYAALLADTNVTKSATGEMKLYIHYSATVQASAAVSDKATNAAQIVWKSNLASSPVTSAPDVTTTYSFAIDLSKVNDATPSAALPGAGFKVYPTQGSDSPIEFIKDGDYYRPFVDGDDTAQKATEITVGSTGKFLIKGLNAGDYWLEESKVPEGYYAPAKTTGADGSDRFQITLTADANSGEYTGKLNTTSTTISSPTTANNDLITSQTVNNDTYTITLKNSSTPVLPTTGGMGTMLFTVLGVVLMALAAGLFFFRRRKNA